MGALMTSNSRKPAGLTALLDGVQVRRVEHDGEMVFAAVDVVASLVETQYPCEYWQDLKGRESALERLVEQVEFVTPDGARAVEDAVRVEGLLRIVQSLSSPKAERIKNWLATSARERIEEAENPELAF